jgi:aminotransferase EvaB
MQQLNDLSSKVGNNLTSIKTAIDRVVASGWFVLGPELERFERLFATYLGAEHCVGLANGTDAIELALRALAVNPGDKVATVANAGMYTTTALSAIGARPLFIDVDLGTHNTTLAEVMRAVDSGVKAVVITHLYGLIVPEISQIAEYCAVKKVPLLEDCAQAHGARMNGQRAGTFGDAASFSFYPTKNLGALGDAGAVVTDNAGIAQKVGHLRQYGWTTKYRVDTSGARNSRLDEIQAAVLSEFLPLLDDANARRREIAHRYSTQIEHPAVIAPQRYDQEYVAHLYVVRTQSRDALQHHLLTRNIASAVHYPIPDYRQPAFAHTLDESMPLLQNTEQLCREVLSLPCYPEMTDKEVAEVVKGINSWQI